jgi:hypothetical protein
MMPEDSKLILVASILRGNREIGHPKLQLVKLVEFNLGPVGFVANNPN